MPLLSTAGTVRDSVLSVVRYKNFNGRNSSLILWASTVYNYLLCRNVKPFYVQLKGVVIGCRVYIVVYGWPASMKPPNILPSYFPKHHPSILSTRNRRKKKTRTFNENGLLIWRLRAGLGDYPFFTVMQDALSRAHPSTHFSSLYGQ